MSKSLLSDRCVDEARPLKVICIGAGISGIITAIMLPQKIQKLDLVIYDKNKELGGAWYENQYPGCGCGMMGSSSSLSAQKLILNTDVPSHTYQLSFESNPSWTSFYSSGKEILDYWKKVAAKYDCQKYMRLGTKALEARWDEGSSKWHLILEEVASGRRFNAESDVLIAAMGALNDWHWPDIPGLHDFKGKLLHSAAWDPEYDYIGKEVAVIGSGSSGIQMVPALQPKVKHLKHFIRGRMWLSPEYARSEVDKRTKESNFKFTEDEKQSWHKDPAEYLNYRKSLEAEVQGFSRIVIRDGDAQKMARPYFEHVMRERLASRPDILDQILPSFAPLCKRIVTGSDYLGTVIADNVSLISNGISRVTSDGITTADGVQHPVDAIFCATGFDTTWLNRFPIHGRDSGILADHWKTRTSTYLSIATSSYPNFFMASGPNSYLATGNLIVLLENQIQYVAECLAKMQSQNIRTMTPKESAVTNFTDFCDEYFAGTVFSEECSSWYKSPAGGRVTALWPGSSLHAIRTFQQPRWEDFDYEYVDGNHFGWIGSGWSEGDFGDAESKSYYLNKGGMLTEPLENGDAPTNNGH